MIFDSRKEYSVVNEYLAMREYSAFLADNMGAVHVRGIARPEKPIY